MRNRAIKCRLYPTQKQISLFCRTFGCCRKVWNVMLEDKQAYYKETSQMLHNTPAQYKDKYPYLKEADSLALANVQFNLEDTFISVSTNGFRHRSYVHTVVRSRKWLSMSERTAVPNAAQLLTVT